MVLVHFSRPLRNVQLFASISRSLNESHCTERERHLVCNELSAITFSLRLEINMDVVPEYLMHSEYHI